MSPDAGRTENQKHKQYKLVLKSSELDRFSCLLSFAFGQSGPEHRRVPRGGGECAAAGSHIWLRGCSITHLAMRLQGHPVRLRLSSSASVLGRGFGNRGVLLEP